MNSDNREDVRIFFGKLDRAPAALDRSSDRDDARHAGFSRATKHVVEIVREIGIIEMRVSFDQHFQIRPTQSDSMSWSIFLYRGWLRRGSRSESCMIQPDLSS